MISEFNRSNNFFLDKQTGNDKTIYAQDIDSQFNEVGDYLNDVLKPAVSSLSQEKVGGVGGYANAILSNVGSDLAVIWKLIDDNNIDNYSIDLKKFTNITPNSVLVSDAIGKIVSSTSNINGQVLVSQELAPPIFRYLNSNDLGISALTGKQLGVLGLENFVDNLFTTTVETGSIATDNIADGSILNTNIAPGSITSDKIGIFYSLPLQPLQISMQAFSTNAITSSKIKDGSINFSEHFASGAVSIENIADGSITDQNFIMWLPSNFYVTPGKGSGKIDYSALCEGFKLTGEHVMLDSLSMLCFDDDVQKAMTAFRK